MSDRIRIHRNTIYHVFSRTLSEVQKNKTRSHKTHPESHQASSKCLTSTSSQILSKEFKKSLETSPSQTGTVQNFSIKKYQIPKFRKDPHPTPNFSITEVPPTTSLSASIKGPGGLPTAHPEEPSTEGSLEGSAP